MPLLMDDSLDIDDLFADDGALSLPQAPVTKGLVQRLDELRLLGCSQKMACSKLGSVAAITADGRAIDVRVLFCDPNDGKWNLSRPSHLDQVTAAHEGYQLSHLSWNNTGVELAVVDVLGRISIFQMVVAMNKMVQSRLAKSDHQDDLGVVVGMTWLNLERQFPWYQSAMRTDGRFRLNILQYRMPGQLVAPYKAALLCLTRGGMLRLLYQQPDTRWQETGTELESLSTFSDVLTHASFCPERDGSLLLIVHSMSHQHRLYRVQIKWTPAPQPGPNGQAPPHPEILVTNVKSIVPGFDDIQLPQQDADEPARVQPQLSHLELLPVPPHMPSGDSIKPTVMAVFSHLSDPQSATYQESCSIVARWELQAVQPKLHPLFDQLNMGTKKTGSVLMQDHQLRRLDDIVLDKIIVSIQLVHSGSTLAFSYSDGSIEFRQRTDLTVIGSDDDPNRVVNLPRTGFAFPLEEPFLHSIISPNSCLAATMDDEGHVKLKAMRCMLKDIDAMHENVVLALAMQYAHSVTHYTTGDDVLAVVQQMSKPNIEKDLVGEIYRALSQSADFTPDQHTEKSSSAATIQKCLSVQDSLGRHSGQQHKSIAAKVAWTTLNLRFVSLNFYILATNAIKPGVEVDLNRLGTDMLQYTLGLIRWTIDLISFLTDDLLEIGSLLKGRFDRADVVNETAARLGSCSLSLVTASVSRFFLRHAVRNVGLLGSAAQRGLLQPTTDLEHRKLFRSVKERIESGAVQVAQFDRFIKSVDTSIKTTYQQKEVSDAVRALTEKNMLTTGEIPDMLMRPTMQDLFQTHLMTLRDEMADPAKAYFADYSWIGLSDDRRTQKFWKENIVDVINKVIIPRSGTRQRRRDQSHGQGQGSHLQQPAPSKANAKAVPDGILNGAASVSMNGAGSSNRVDVGVSSGVGAEINGRSGTPGMKFRQCTRCGSVMEDSLVPGGSSIGASKAASGTSAAAAAGGGGASGAANTGNGPGASHVPGGASNKSSSGTGAGAGAGNASTAAAAAGAAGGGAGGGSGATTGAAAAAAGGGGGGGGGGATNWIQAPGHGPDPAAAVAVAAVASILPVPATAASSTTASCVASARALVGGGSSGR